MKELRLRIEKEECYGLTRDIFLEMSGIDKEGAKFERMREDANCIRDQIEDRIDIKIACNYYDDIELAGSTALIGGDNFECRAFEQIDRSTLNGAYVYSLTAGEYDSKEQSILNRLYADFWGTSFAEAARILLSKELSKNDRLSDSFGPGFYGMDLTEMKKIDDLMDFKKIGLELRNNKILVPVKSCAGILFSVTDGYIKMNNACRDCIGSERSCKLCRQRQTGDGS